MLGGVRWSGHAAGRINTYIDDPLLNLLGTQEQRDKQLQASLLGGVRWSGHAAERINTYIDDPLSNLLGTQEQRDKQLQAVLLFWTAAGFKVAWAKGTRSKVAKWIGLEFTPDFQSQTVTVRIPAKTADAFKQDAQKLLSAPMIPLKMLRQLAGKGGWIMNLLPKARWTIQRLWRAIAEEERRRSSLAAGNERRPTRGGMRTHLVARRQVEVALRWIVAFWGDQGLSFSRVFGETRPLTEFELIFDASPWALGGVLTTAKSGIALQFFHEPLTEEDFARFNLQAGDAKGQQYWEALSVLVGLKLWAPLVAKSSAIVQVKSDSVTALQCTAKLASSSPLLNGIGAEIALVLELYDIEEIVTQHVPGKLNEVADKLSRMAQPGASQFLPPQLDDAKRRVTPKRNDAFFRS